MIKSLWGEEFNIESTPEKSKKILNKINNEVSDEKKLKSKKTPVEEKLQIIKENVLRVLGRYKDNTCVIKTREELHSYIDEALKNNVIAVDTETNRSLDPITCILMGGCIYTPGQKNAYIPVNHTDLQGNRLEWQLTESDIKEELDRIKDTTVITHNGGFDYQVLKCTCNCSIPLTWDTMVGARLLDENESAKLKFQYTDKIDSSIEQYSIEDFFKDIEYAFVDPEIFAYYAATDAYMTYKLYSWQKDVFNLPENKRLLDLFYRVEMPIVKVAADMELEGVEIDKDYAHRLSISYHKDLDLLDESINKELEELQPSIRQWRLTPEANAKSPKTTGEGFNKSKSDILEDPIKISSPIQLAILLYDVMKAPVVNEKSPRSTDKKALKKLSSKYKLADLILQRRGVEKLLSAFIDTIPLQVSEKDGRLHAKFNPLGREENGVVTGRFSCTDPNLQQIPSGEKSIRLMFRAREGYSIVGSDFSQQEPRLLAHYAQDEKMIEAYLKGQDLYATMASRIYGNKYEDNLEHWSDGTPNPEGKKRRGGVKSVVLGLLYGRGTSSVAEQLGVSIKEAQDLIDRFFEGFPKIKSWISEAQKDTTVKGYAEGLLGRRRRLPDINLPKYQIKNKKDKCEFNPFLGTKGKTLIDPEAQLFLESLNKASTRKEVDSLKKQLNSKGYTVQDNTGFISHALRQCINARVQGGAATISKLAMIAVHNDEEMHHLGFKLLICVHDELIGECPRANAELVAQRLSDLMVKAAAEVCSVPMKCDAVISSRWYEDDFYDYVHEKYQEALSQTHDVEDLRNQYINKFSMINPANLTAMLDGTYQINKYYTI